MKFNKNRFKRSFKAVFSLLLVLTLIFSSGVANVLAKDTETLKKEQSDLSSKIEANKKKLNQLEKDKNEIQAYIKALNEKVSLVQEEIDLYQSQIDALNARIEETEQKIAEIEQEIAELAKQIEENQKRFDENYELYCERLRAIYMSGSVTNLEVIMTCDDLSTLLTRAQMVKSVSEKDQETLDKLMQTMEEIKREQAELENKKKVVEKSKDELVADQNDLKTARNEVQAKMDELKADREKRNTAIMNIASEQDDLRKNIASDEAELKKVNDEMYNTVNNYTGNVQQGTGQFTHPAPGYSYVGAGFPNYKSGAYHGGVDFVAPTGTPVYAADSGTVVYVKYLNYSYGYHIFIAHGNNLYTLYAHNSAILVSAGQNVSKGQQIAKVGNTGNSSGSHLHFEVRAGGAQYRTNNVNPWNYL